jgi:hypothetical protein
MARLIDLKNLTLSPEKQKSNIVLGTSPESGILLMFGAGSYSLFHAPERDLIV